jgi:hypothetical protein
MKRIMLLEESLWIMFISVFYFGEVWNFLINLFLVLCFVNENIKSRRNNISLEIFYEVFCILLTVINITYFYELTLIILFVNSLINFFEHFFLSFEIFQNKEIGFLCIEYFCSIYIFYKKYRLKIIPIVLFGVICRHILHNRYIDKKIFLRRMIGTYYTIIIYNLCLFIVYLFDN